MNEPLVRAEELVKDYRMGRERLRVLHGVSLSVAEGEFVAVLGPCGSGKSTLLHLLGLLDRPTEGRVHFAGENAFARSRRWRDRRRNTDIGFVFQFYHLMPDLSVLENVTLPGMIRTPAVAWPGASGERRRAREVLERVGLAERLAHRPRELSGGERQRAALARALVSEPRVLMADEPTGNLDSATGGEIIDLIADLNRDENLTIVMVTHDERIAVRADRVLRLTDGRLLADVP